MKITLRLPNKALHPNGGKKHNVMKLNRITREHQELAYYVTLEQTNGDVAPNPESLDYDFVLSKHVSRAPDQDNLVAWCKAYQDGIATACCVDDSQFSIGRVRWRKAARGEEPHVTITLKEA